jgi:hypothetical protein
VLIFVFLLFDPLVAKAEEIQPGVGLRRVINDNPLVARSAHGRVFFKIPEVFSCPARRKEIRQLFFMAHFDHMTFPFSSCAHAV